MADENWGPALGEYAFRGRLEFFLKYPDDKDTSIAFTSDKHGLGCYGVTQRSLSNPVQTAVTQHISWVSAKVT